MMGPGAVLCIVNVCSVGAMLPPKRILKISKSALADALSGQLGVLLGLVGHGRLARQTAFGSCCFKDTLLTNFFQWLAEPEQ